MVEHQLVMERVTIVEKSSDPVSFTEALDREDKSQWINAMDKEMDSLSANEVYMGSYV